MGPTRGTTRRRTGRWAAPAAAVALVVVLGGCGAGDAPSGESPPDAAGPTSTAPSTPTTPTAEPTGLLAPADDTWEPWGKGRPRTDLAPDVDAAGSAQFAAAAGALACVVGPADGGGATVRCDRTRGLGVDQPRPPACEGTWGDAVVATTGAGGELVCATDSLLGDDGDGTGAAWALAEGDAVRYRGLTCTSRADAVQCLDATARGFVVSPTAIVVR